MKKMTLTKTWTECLRMWKWISKRKGNVWVLKSRWMKENGYRSIAGNCFFCQYHNIYGKEKGGECNGCPGVKVDKQFDCYATAYSFEHHPKEFYQEILKLYGRRQKKLLQRRKSKC